MKQQRPDVILRKAQIDDEKPVRKIIVDLLKTSAIIADNFTGSLLIEFHNGGICGTELKSKNLL
jgi:hypothetical protein